MNRPRLSIDPGTLYYMAIVICFSMTVVEANLVLPIIEEVFVSVVPNGPKDKIKELMP